MGQTPQTPGQTPESLSQHDLQPAGAAEFRGPLPMPTWVDGLV